MIATVNKQGHVVFVFDFAPDPHLTKRERSRGVRRFVARCVLCGKRVYCTSSSVSGGYSFSHAASERCPVQP